MWLKEKISKLVKKHKTNDPFELAAYMNIIVIFWDLHEQIKGYYKYDRRNRYIVINQNLSDAWKKLVCAHELGHALLHTRINTPFMRLNTLMSVDKVEREANEFAVNLLLYGVNFEDYETIYDLLRENGIPLEMERFINVNK